MNKTPRILGLLAGFVTASLVVNAQTFYIDFGPTLTETTGWNNVAGASNTAATLDLEDSTGAATNVDLTTAASPANFTNAGTGSAATAAFGAFTANAVSDYLASSQTSTTLTLTGLDPTKTYTFEIFASRAAGTRTTVYTFNNSGVTSEGVTSLDAGGNISNTAILSSFAPSATGTILLTLTRDVTNTSGFTYINAMTITTVSAIPEPSTYASLLGVGVIGYCAIRRRRNIVN